MTYDSTQDTKEHINIVRSLMLRIEARIGVRRTVHDIVRPLMLRIEARIGVRRTVHDVSKTQEPEKSMYDEFTPRLRDMTYDSDEYKSCLQEMGPALQHHYAANSHHPEHYPNGINGMSLLDLIEMLADWKAASLRHADGDFRKSLAINKERFGISDQLHQILLNTVEELGW